MNRRSFLDRIGRSVFAPALVGGLHGCVSARKRPDIILVTMDTARKDHFGCYNYRLPTTPNLDRFAEEALVFDGCYASSNHTMPNHLSIFTGRYPHNCCSLSGFGIEAGTASLVSKLKTAGYATGAATSVFFLDNERTAEGAFDEFSSITVEEERRAAEYTTDEATGILDSLKRTGKPVFFWVHYYDPHEPYAPPQVYRDMFFTGGIDRERLDLIIENRPHEQFAKEFPPEFPRQLTEQDHDAIISQYDGEMAYMDHHIGRLIDYLKRTGIYDTSIIVFTSDHGESLFENDDDRLGHYFLYEPVVQIPLIVKHPDIVPNRIPQLVQNIDIAPTILNWVGLKMDGGAGKDLDSAIHSGSRIRDNVLFEEGSSSVVGITFGDYKLRELVFRAKQMFPIPRRWLDETETLPLIEFTSGLKSEWDFERDNGEVMYAWKPPAEVAGRIESYSWESYVGKENVFGGMKKSEFLIEMFRTRRFWNGAAGYSPIRVRVTGQDKDGATIAVSRPILLNLLPSMESTELFNLSEDPDEQHNLVLEMPEKVEQMEEAMRTFVEGALKYKEKRLEHVFAREGARSPQLIDEETIRGLQTLGYIQ